MPRKKDEKAQQLSIRLPDGMYNKLVAYAQEQDVYLNQVILQMIRKGMSLEQATRDYIEKHHDEIIRDAIEIEKSRKLAAGNPLKKADSASA